MHLVLFLVGLTPRLRALTEHEPQRCMSSSVSKHQRPMSTLLESDRKVGSGRNVAVWLCTRPVHAKHPQPPPIQGDFNRYFMRSSMLSTCPAEGGSTPKAVYASGSIPGISFYTVFAASLRHPYMSAMTLPVVTFICIEVQDWPSHSDRQPKTRYLTGVLLSNARHAMHHLTAWAYCEGSCESKKDCLGYIEITVAVSKTPISYR